MKNNLMGFKIYLMKSTLLIGEAIVRLFLTEFNGVWFYKNPDAGMKAMARMPFLKALTSW